MYTFQNPYISFADNTDIPEIEALLNSAYRGESSKKGWTTEAHLIQGDIRTDTKMLQEVMEQPGSVFLKYTGDDKKIKGCVNLQQHDKKIYLGMFSVSPHLQGGGIGKEILKAAEEYTRYKNCYSIYMLVISARTDLINWYVRHGYTDTGKRKPFSEDPRTGKHVQPLEFMVLEKSV